MVYDKNEIVNDPGVLAKVGGITIGAKKVDGWGNVLAGLGKLGTDKTMSTTYDTAPTLDDTSLGQLYMGEGIAKRIIDIPAKDAIREWIKTPGDPDGKILEELKRLDAKTAFQKALSWTRLYRGAVIVMVEKGQVDLSKPLSSNPKEINSLRVYSATKIDITETDIVEDPSSKYFDEIEIFPIRLRSGSILRVHTSRCLVFKGEQAPDDSKIDFKYRYWGLPFILPVYNRLKNYGAMEQAISNLMLEFNIGKFTISNLAQLLASNTTDSVNQIYTRMEIINASKSLINSVLLGDGESYDRDSANLSGVPDIIDRGQITLAAVSDIPVTKLWGRSPAGENATGESDIIQYYDSVASIQETKAERQLKKLCNVVGNYLNIKDSSFQWNALWQPTEKEQAEVNKINAETDAIYITQGVYAAQEIREYRKYIPESDITSQID